MGGGQYEIENKVLPGVYINIKSKPSMNVVMGERGIVAIAKQLSWGEQGKLIEIEGVNNLQLLTGYSQTSPENLFIRELMRGSNLTSGASKILLWRLEETGGAKASLEVEDGIKISTKYVGKRGNDIAVIISPVLESKNDEGTLYYQWTIEVVVDGLILESFTRGIYTGRDAGSVEATVKDFMDIESNWIQVSGTETANLETMVATNLTDGKDGTILPSAHNNFISAIAKVNFNVIVYDGEDTITKGAYKSLVNRLCTEEGRYCVAVISEYKADSEYVINVSNAFTNEEGVALTTAQATWWVGGASAGANYWESLTYHNVPNASQVEPEYENSELAKRLSAGEFLFFKMDDEIKVLSDVSSFTSVNVNKSKAFCKNRVVRTIMQICNDLYLGYSKYYIGIVDVNDAGVNLVKAYGIDYLNKVMAKNAIQNFVPDDYQVSQFEIDSMKIAMQIQPVDSLEKIYIEMTIG